uniref:Uncharacterized protein n=2 Tax=Oryza TaxID=4527 RepID=A0A0D9YTC1_9ORYZ
MPGSPNRHYRHPPKPFVAPWCRYPLLCNQPPFSTTTVMKLHLFPVSSKVPQHRRSLLPPAALLLPSNQLAKMPLLLAPSSTDYAALAAPPLAC